MVRSRVVLTSSCLASSSERGKVLGSQGATTTSSTSVQGEVDLLDSCECCDASDRFLSRPLWPSGRPRLPLVRRRPFRLAATVVVGVTGHWGGPAEVEGVEGAGGRVEVEGVEGRVEMEGVEGAIGRVEWRMVDEGGRGREDGVGAEVEEGIG